MKFEFYGREKELRLLDQLWASPKSEFLIVYDRRRVDKTALLYG
jgi:AAA+ ATPase superfamily predicted ATPase